LAFFVVAFMTFAECVATRFQNRHGHGYGNEPLLLRSSECAPILVDPEAQASAMAAMNVQIPAGMGPGKKFIAQSPDGQHIEVLIPAGATAGMMLQIENQPHKLKMHRITDVEQLAALQRICHVDKPEELGSGRDFQRYGEKQNAGWGPKVIGGWVIDNPALKVGYKGSRMLVSSACTKLQPSPVHLRPKFEQAVQNLLVSMGNRYGILSESLNSSINEKFLLHSPNMDAAHAIIENGQV
jgi:hypothetical protein